MYYTQNYFFRISNSRVNQEVLYMKYIKDESSSRVMEEEMDRIPVTTASYGLMFLWKCLQ